MYFLLPQYISPPLSSCSPSQRLSFPSISFLLPKSPPPPSLRPLSFALSDERACASCSLSPHAHTRTQRLSSVPERAESAGPFAWIWSLFRPACVCLLLTKSCVLRFSLLCAVSTLSCSSLCFCFSAGVSGKHHRLCPFRDTDWPTIWHGAWWCQIRGRLVFGVRCFAEGKTFVSTGEILLVPRP